MNDSDASGGVDQRLTDLFDILGRSADAMVAIGADMTIVGWNQAAVELFGYQPDEVLGTRCDEVLHWRNRCGDLV